MPDLTWFSMKSEKVSSIILVAEDTPDSEAWKYATQSLLTTVVDEFIRKPPPRASVRSVKRLPDRMYTPPGMSEEVLVAEFEAEILFPEDWKMSHED